MKVYIGAIILAVLISCVWYLSANTDYFSHGETAEETIRADNERETVVSSRENGRSSAGNSKNAQLSTSERDKPDSTHKLSDDRSNSDEKLSVQSAFAYEVPIISAYEFQGAAGSDANEERLRNLAVWMELCEEPQLVTYLHESQHSSSVNIGSKVDIFCEGFSQEKISEINQYLTKGTEKISERTNQSRKFNRMMRNEGTRSAAEFALIQIEDALSNLDFGGTLQWVWQLMSIPAITTNLPDSEIESVISESSKVADAVAAAVYCQALGGCGPDHPVTIWICFHNWPNRECSQPRDVHDAAQQVLTGNEYDEYLEMLNFVTSGIGSRN